MRSPLNYFNLIVSTLLLSSTVLNAQKTNAIELLAQQPIPQGNTLSDVPIPPSPPQPITIPQGNLQRDDDRNRRLEADRLFKTGEEQLQKGELETALKTFEQVLAIRREIGDKAGESDTLFKLAEVTEKLGQNERSRQYYQQAQAARSSGISFLRIPQGTALRDDNSQPVATQEQNPPTVTTDGARSVAQTALRDDDTRSNRQQTPLPSPGSVAQPTPLRDRNPGDAAIAQTPLRDDDTRAGRSQRPFRAVTQPTTLRDDNSNRIPGARDGSSGASAIAQTPLRDDNTRASRSQTPLASPGSVAQPTALRDDNPNSTARSNSPENTRNPSEEVVAITQELRRPDSTALRDDNPNRIANMSDGGGTGGASAVVQTPLRDDDPNRIAGVSDRKIEADRLFQTGMQQLQRNQLQPALATFQQVLAIRRELGDKIGQGQTLFQLGQVSEKLGQNQQAQDYYRQAREINR
jgi:tetratricopeptide (TPR) repeat protein